jgi:hypothetical protein
MWNHIHLHQPVDEQGSRRYFWVSILNQKGLIFVGWNISGVQRVIPVCDRVLDALMKAYRPGSHNQPMVRSPMGCSYAIGNRSWCNYSGRIRRLLKSRNSDIGWTPKDLRKCLPQFFRKYSLEGPVSELYLGHTPGDITSSHYAQQNSISITTYSEGERLALEEQMDLFRARLIDPLNLAIGRGGRAKILNIFERNEKRPEIDDFQPRS